MKFFKITLFYIVLFLNFTSVSYSSESELSPIHIAVLEDPAFIEKSPFSSRVHIFGLSDLEKDEDFNEHGVEVCSILVGDNSRLPEDTSITLVPSLKQFSSYINTRAPNDLVILNWSGCACYPGLSEDVLDDLEEIAQHFNTILSMDETEFTVQVHDYIEDYDTMLEQLGQNDNPLSVLLNHAKTCLLNAAKQPTLLKESKDIYSTEVSDKIEGFKEYAEEQAKLRFEEMKVELCEILQQHNNTLIVWALGNDGLCIDTDPFWQGLLNEELVLSHTVLVHGLQSNGRKNVESNYTRVYLDHAIGKPYQTQVWNYQKSRYIQDRGTSFSAPLATTDVFIKAKEMINQTSQTPCYADVKRALLMKDTNSIHFF